MEPDHHTLSEKDSEREVNRVRAFIYVMSAFSFCLGLLEGFTEQTPTILIIHFCVSLVLLILASWCFEKPLLIILTCMAIQSMVLISFVVYDEIYSRLILLKVMAILIPTFGIKPALNAQRLLKQQTQKSR